MAIPENDIATRKDLDRQTDLILGQIQRIVDAVRDDNKARIEGDDALARTIAAVDVRVTRIESRGAAAAWIITILGTAGAWLSGVFHHK